MYSSADEFFVVLGSVKVTERKTHLHIEGSSPGSHHAV
jgi:hypothetical protein